MTVKELIEALQKFPQEAEVVNFDHEWGYGLASVPKLLRNVEINNDPFSKKSEKIKVAVVV